MDLNRNPARRLAPNGPQPLLTEREAADYARLSVGFFRAARLNGGGPPFLKIGRSVRYRLADLKTWLESCRVEPPL